MEKTEIKASNILQGFFFLIIISLMVVIALLELTADLKDIKYVNRQWKRNFHGLCGYSSRRIFCVVFFFPLLYFHRYLVTNLMGADLNNIVKCQKLTDDHIQFLIYQLLRGLKVLSESRNLNVVVMSQQSKCSKHWMVAMSILKSFFFFFSVLKVHI